MANVNVIPEIKAICKDCGTEIMVPITEYKAKKVLLCKRCAKAGKLNVEMMRMTKMNKGKGIEERAEKPGGKKWCTWYGCRKMQVNPPKTGMFGWFGNTDGTVTERKYCAKHTNDLLFEMVKRRGETIEEMGVELEDQKKSLKHLARVTFWAGLGTGMTLTFMLFAVL